MARDFDEALPYSGRVHARGGEGRGGGVRECLKCGNEARLGGNYASYVPADDDEEWWECGHCGLKWTEEWTGTGGSEPSRIPMSWSEKKAMWRMASPGCLLVLSWEEASGEDGKA